MRTFNPEKELNKIQKGNKNKIIIGVCLLLLIVAIGSSYALYQIRYNKRIIYTTVDKFYSKDLQLAVYVDGVKQDDFPEKEEGYLYEDIECENDDITASFNNNTWKLNLELGKPNKCNVKFTSNPFKADICKDTTMSECLLKEEMQYNKDLADDDPDNNARYIGAEPANYIWFNCDNYDKPSVDSCERWQIIGSFKGAKKVNEDGSTTQQNLVKIIRNTPIGNIPWNNKGTNDWMTATLQINLNNEYLREEDNGSWIMSEENIKNSGGNPPSKSSNYKSITSSTLNMIENVVWNLGGIDYTATNSLKDLYTFENSVAEDETSIWQGKIALIYGGDVAYAFGGDTKDSCLQSKYNSISSECKLTNWFMSQHPTGGSNCIWLLSRTAGIWGAKTLYGVFGGDGTRYGHTIYPSLYLTHETRIISGDGTYENPYIINTN